MLWLICLHFFVLAFLHLSILILAILLLSFALFLLDFLRNMPLVRYLTRFSKIFCSQINELLLSLGFQGRPLALDYFFYFRFICFIVFFLYKIVHFLTEYCECFCLNFLFKSHLNLTFFLISTSRLNGNISVCLIFWFFWSIYCSSFCIILPFLLFVFDLIFLHQNSLFNPSDSLLLTSDHFFNSSFQLILFLSFEPFFPLHSELLFSLLLQPLFFQYVVFCELQTLFLEMVEVCSYAVAVTLHEWLHEILVRDDFF